MEIKTAFNVGDTVYIRPVFHTERLGIVVMVNIEIGPSRFPNYSYYVCCDDETKDWFSEKQLRSCDCTETTEGGGLEVGN